MYIRDTQTGGVYGAQNPYIEGALKIQYYLDGEDITDSIKERNDVNYPTTLYCYWYQTGQYGTLNIKYYYRVDGVKFEGSKIYNLVLPGTKLQSITPGSTSEWQYKLLTGEVSGNFYYRDYPDSNDTVTVNLVTDPDSSLKITVSTSDESKGDVMIRPDKEAYNTNDEVEIEAIPAPGYDFDYWKVTQITSYDVEIPKDNVTKNPYKFNVITSEKYEAYFKIKEIQINCYNNPSNSDDWDICDNFSAKYGEELKNRLVPYETGYKFIGYFSEKGGQGKQYYKIDYVELEDSSIVERAIGMGVCDFATSPASLYAYYELETYDITYHLNGGSGDMSPTYYNVETPTFSLPIPSRNGYNFKGWYENNQFSGSQITQIPKGSTGDKQFWAKWEEEEVVSEDDKIATRSLIATKSNYVFEFTGDEKKCPTKSEINSGSNNIANISNNYENNKCVKYADVIFNTININCKIETSIVAFVKSPCVEIFRGSTKFATLYTASSTNDMNEYNNKSSTTAIDCTHLNDSSSKDAKLSVRVYNANWIGNRYIKVTCNGKTVNSGQTKDFIADFDIYFKDFLKNKYDVNVFFHE